jgi:putative exosortase-associated protein (TIGR04073 family)
MEKRFFIGLMIVMTVAGFVPQVFAGEGTAGDYFSDIGSKFGRGLSDIVTGPVEVPCNVANQMDSMGPYKGFFPGIGVGLFKMGRRMFNGVLDVGTFMIPAPPSLPAICADRKKSQAPVTNASV